MLPAGWEANKEVYTLRYKSMDDARELLLKAIMVEDSMILNAMVSTHAGPCGFGVLGEQWLQRRAGSVPVVVVICCTLQWCLSLGMEQNQRVLGVDGAAADVAQREAGHTHQGSNAVCLVHSGPGAAPFLSLSQLRTHS